MVAMSRRAKRAIEKNTPVQPTEEAKAKLRAVGYCRVSTDTQEANGTSLESQSEAIAAFAKSQGYELIGIYQDAESGAIEPKQREGYSQIIELVEAGEVDVVLVWKFDRLSRSIEYSVVAVNELSKANVALKSVTEPIDTSSPIGLTIFSVLAGMAQMERDNITTRTKGGRIKKAEKGGVACGTTPLGYKRTDNGLEIDEREAATVRRIYELRESELTFRAIAQKLTDEGYQTKKGGKWYASTIAAILDNAKYRGYVEYVFKEKAVVVPGHHEPII